MEGTASNGVGSDPNVIDRVTILTARRPGPYERWVKRPVDVIGALVLLVVTAPIQVAVAVGVAITMGRPVVFRQTRLTRGGQDFTMYKFRSMTGTDRPVHAADLHHTPHDHPRLTPFGRFIRRFSLDELPQLVNVLEGDMSLIGPRPELRSVAEAYGIVDHPRHHVRPGLTGAWQVSPLRHQFVHMNVHIDAEYVGHLTLRRDLAIAARTVGVVLIGKRRERPCPTSVADLGAGRRPLRVLHVLEPAIAGVPAYVDALGRELAARSVEQVVIANERCTHDFAAWADEVHLVRWRRRHPGDTLAVASLASHLTARGRVDLVHAHASFAGLAVRIRRLGARVVYQPHGWGHLSTRRRWAGRLARFVEHRLARRTDLLLLLSRHEAAAAPAARRSALVRPICDLGAFDAPTAERRAQLRRAHDWSDEDVVHLCVGEFSRRKNQSTLVECWHRLAAPPHRLVLVGDGVAAPETDGALADTIEIRGWSDDVAGFMAAADTLLVPSRGEGFSLVVLEALASGLPVFCTDVGGSEIVRSRDGAVCESVDAVVSTALTSPLVPSRLADRVGRARHHHLEAGIERIGDEFCQLYGGLMLPIVTTFTQRSAIEVESSGVAQATTSQLA